MNRSEGLIRRFLPVQIQRIILRPRYPDQELDRQASVLYAALTPIFILSLLLFPILYLIGAPPVTVIPVFMMLGVESGVYWLLHHGQVRRASILLVTVGWAITTLPAYTQGGIISPFTLFSMLWVVVTGLLLERRFLVAMLVINLVNVTLLLMSTTYNWVPPLIPLATPLRYWNILMIVLIMASVLLNLATTSLRASLSAAQTARADLQAINQELTAARQDLEKRVADRTSDLEVRARELQASADVVRAIASIRSLDELLAEITHLLSDQFGFYYVSVFLLDDSNTQLIIRASNNDVGRKMAQDGFSIPLERASLVTTAVRTRKPYLAADVSQEPQYLALAELPDTRSELVLPLFVSQRMMGALDLQSTSIAAFSAQDLNILQTLANQIAIAIENARLFTQNQQALDSLQQAYSSLSQEGWQRLLRAQPDMGYRVGAAGSPTPVTGDWPPEMQQALNSGRVVQADTTTLAAPVKIRGQVTGVLRLRKQLDSGGWAPDEIALVQTITDRLSTALESARLYEETRRRAERERLTGEITARMRSSNDPQTILQIAARELRKALQADKAQLVVQAAPAGLLTPQPDEEIPAEPPNGPSGQQPSQNGDQSAPEDPSRPDDLSRQEA